MRHISFWHLQLLLRVCCEFWCSKDFCNIVGVSFWNDSEAWKAAHIPPVLFSNTKSSLIEEKVVLHENGPVTFQSPNPIAGSTLEVASLRLPGFSMLLTWLSLLRSRLVGSTTKLLLKSMHFISQGDKPCDDYHDSNKVQNDTNRKRIVSWMSTDRTLRHLQTVRNLPTLPPLGHLLCNNQQVRTVQHLQTVRNFLTLLPVDIFNQQVRTVLLAKNRLSVLLSVYFSWDI